MNYISSNNCPNLFTWILISEKHELYFFEQLSKLVYMNPTFIRRIYSYNCLSTNWPDTNFNSFQLWKIGRFLITYGHEKVETNLWSLDWSFLQSQISQSVFKLLAVMQNFMFKLFNLLKVRIHLGIISVR